MEINLVALWNQMGLPVKGVVLFLTIQALASLTMAIDRAVMLFRARRSSQTFIARAGHLTKSRDFESLLTLASETKGSHLATLMHAGLQTFLDRSDAGDSASTAAERTRRALERRGETVSTQLNHGMNVLASTGSTAPFVGLLGTVLGIIHAFKMISVTGSGGLGSIGSAIGESLIVTGYGLCVAIPTVLLFNAISSAIANYEQSLASTCGELVDQLETEFESQSGSSEPSDSHKGRGRPRHVERAALETVAAE